MNGTVQPVNGIGMTVGSRYDFHHVLAPLDNARHAAALQRTIKGCGTAHAGANPDLSRTGR